MGQNSSDGIVTHYGLDSPGIKSQWGKIFHTIQTSPGANPASYTVRTNQLSILGVKWPGCGIDHPPPSSAKIKERIDLYLYSPSGPSWPVIRLLLAFVIVHTPVNRFGHLKERCLNYYPGVWLFNPWRPKWVIRNQCHNISINLCV
jgi:hypothetical protein